MLNNISPKICEKAGGVYNYFIKKPALRSFLEQGKRDPANFAAKMLVYSLISKDAVNCVIYTTQSATNQRIPKEKRSFVTYNDLINGILNVGGQLLSFAVVDKYIIPKLFGKHYSGNVKNPLTKEEKQLYYTEDAKLFSDNLRDIVKGVLDPECITGKNKKIVEKIKAEMGDLSHFTKEDMAKIEKQASEALIKHLSAGSGKFGSIEKGFALLITALATNALIKRTLVPLISTPIAGALSDRALKKNAKHDAMVMTPEMINMTMPKIGNKKESALDKTI